MSLRMPSEHGAWGILAVPFLCATAVGLAGARDGFLPLLLVALLALGIFLLRGSLESYRRWSAVWMPAHLALGGLAAGAGAVLLLAYGRWQLLGLGAAGLALYLAQRALVRAHPRDAEKRSLMAEMVGAALLTLSAPAATVALTGGLDGAGVRVWLLNLLFFAGGVLYVKYRVRGVLVHREFAGVQERFVFAWPVFLYHLLLVLFLTSAALLESLPAMVLLAFAPAVLRAHGLLFHLGRRFPIKRLGWTEVVHSVVFALLLILASRT